MSKNIKRKLAFFKAYLEAENRSKIVQTAATLSVALEHQKKVLKGVQAINETTNDLLLKTFEKLKDQGVLIQQQAMSASVDTDVLRESFKNVHDALKQVNGFRVKALPQMSENIEKMNKINEEMDTMIQEMRDVDEIFKKFQLESEQP